ncbi:MAG: hypothetical protein M1480_11095 [Bacteroidetes bacterium]|nr:hypothetical protein [Bacteroidota bacterium]
MYSILVYAYGIDCQGPLNQSTNYTLDSGVTPQVNVRYYVGCALDSVAVSVRIIVYDVTDNNEIIDVIDNDVKNSNHYFDGKQNHDYTVYISSGNVTGWALCEPDN